MIAPREVCSWIREINESVQLLYGEDLINHMIQDDYTFEEEEEIDIHAVMKEIKELEAKRDELDKEIDVYLKELGLLED